MADTWIPAVGFTPWGKSYPRDVVFVVMHHSGGVAAGDISTLTSGGKVSCHRYVTRDGQRYQFVRDDDIAWTCGVQAQYERNPHPMGSRWSGDENRPAFNVEMENRGRAPFTEQQYNAAADWTADWVRRYGVPFDRQHLLGHRELTVHPLHQNPNDNWDWNRFMQLVGARLGASPTHQDYPIKSDPTITQGRFRDVLAANPRSPVTDQADQAYAICRQFGVNPAVALAFFIKVSLGGTSYGAGGSPDQHNWGNLRDPNSGFTQILSFPTWQQGLVYWCTRLTTVYKNNGWTTLSTIVPRYFSGMSGDPQSIAAELSTMIAAWKAVFDQGGFTPGPPGGSRNPAR